MKNTLYIAKLSNGSYEVYEERPLTLHDRVDELCTYDARQSTSDNQVLQKDEPATLENLGIQKQSETVETIGCPRFPQFVNLIYNGCKNAMRLKHTEFFDDSFHALYYRDAGNWGIYAKYSDKGVLRAVSKRPETHRMHDKPITEISEDQYNMDNEGYV